MAGPMLSSWHGKAHPLTPADAPLARLLDAVWREHFADVPRVNDVTVGFAYPWKWRLGRIRLSLDQRISEITLNRLLNDPDVPEVIYVAIMAHEIVHYAQGFGSPIPRAQRHAHAHGVVSEELAARGLGHTETALETWGATVWPRLQARASRARIPQHLQLVRV